MKKIIGAAAAGLVLTGAAFADVSFAANARIISNAFSYETPSRATQAEDDNGAGIDDVGKVTWAKDTKHSDDVTLNAKGDNAGAKIVFNVSGATNNTDNSKVSLTSYQLWLNFGKIRVDAGAYDQRLAPALNNDGNWNENYSGTNKPGIWVNIDGAAWGKDSMNITGITGNKRTNNFQVSTALNDQLTVRGVLFLDTNGTTANGSSDSSDPWIFTPFALGAEYKLSKDSKIGVVAKLNSISLGSDKTTTKETTTAAGYQKVTYYTVADNFDNSSGKVSNWQEKFFKIGNEFKKGEDLTDDEKMELFGTTDPTLFASDGSTLVDPDDEKGGYYKASTVYVWKEATSTTTTTNDYIKPQNSVWTLAFDYYNKLSSSLEIEATYTLGASLYTNNGKHGAHWDPANKGGSKHLVRDNDVFAHGFDFRVVDKLSNQLSLTGIVGVNYVQGTAVNRSKNRNTSTKGGEVEYKDALAKSYATGAAGVLAYYATVSADYSASDTVTYQLQAKLANDKLFETAGCDSGDHVHVDYLSGMTLNIRPGILLNAQKNCQFFAGFDFGIKGFQTSASGKNNTVQTMYTVPVGMRVKL